MTAEMNVPLVSNKRRVFSMKIDQVRDKPRRSGRGLSRRTMTDCKPFLWYEDDTNDAVAEGAAPEGLRQQQTPGDNSQGARGFLRITSRHPREE